MMVGWTDEWNIKNLWKLMVVSISFYGNPPTQNSVVFNDTLLLSLINSEEGWINRWINYLIKGWSKMMNGGSHLWFPWKRVCRTISLPLRHRWQTK